MRQPREHEDYGGSIWQLAIVVAVVELLARPRWLVVIGLIALGVSLSFLFDMGAF